MRRKIRKTYRYGSIVLVLVQVTIFASSCGGNQQTSVSESKNTSAPYTETAGKSSTVATTNAISNDCEDAVKTAAAISDMQDTVEDLDSAIQKCQVLQEFTAATNKYSKALDGADAKIFATNRCTYNPALQNTAICKSLLNE